MRTEQAATRQAEQQNAAERLRVALVKLVGEVEEGVSYPSDSDLGEAMRNARQVLAN